MIGMEPETGHVITARWDPQAFQSPNAITENLCDATESRMIIVEFRLHPTDSSPISGHT